MDVAALWKNGPPQSQLDVLLDTQYDPRVPVEDTRGRFQAHRCLVGSTSMREVDEAGPGQLFVSLVFDLSI